MPKAPASSTLQSMADRRVCSPSQTRSSRAPTRPFKRCGRLDLLAALLIASLGAAHAEVIDIRWDGHKRFVHEAAIEAGGSVEVCGRLVMGERVRWNFETSAPVEFNVHFHKGKRCSFP